MSNRAIDVENLFGPEERAATYIASLWQDWYHAMSGERELRHEINQFLQATDTKATSNAKNPFANSTHRPKLAQLKDSLVANYKEGIMPGQHWMRFEGADEEGASADKQRAVEAYLETKHRQIDFEDQVEGWLEDWAGAPGNCFGGVEYVHETYTDDDGTTVTAYSGPRPFRIDPNDIVFNLTAKSFEESPKIIRTIKTLGDLKREIVDKPEMGYMADVFTKISDIRRELSSWKVEDVDKYVSLGETGFGTVSQYYRSGFVEILEFFGDLYDPETGEFHKNVVITVVDRKFVIRNEPIKTWTGRPHIYMTGWRRRNNNLLGMSPLANLVGLQFRINHLENTKADAFERIANPDRVEIGLVEQDFDEEGIRTWYAPEGGDVKYISPPTAVLNADMQIQELERSMEEYVGAPSESAMGIRSPGEKTKFEVQTLDTRAGKIFQSKLVAFERFLKQIINAEIEVARRNLDTADIVRVEDDDFGVEEFRRISREDLSVKGTLVPTGARTFARKSRLVQDMRSFMDIINADPEVRQHFPSTVLAKQLEELLDFDRFNLYEPFGRINEQAEAQRTQAAASDQLVEEEAAARAFDNVN